MFFAFLLEGVGIWALYVYGQNPLGFVLLSGTCVLRLGRDLQPLSYHVY
jgi:OFA family oxalate/formate antiporter-like MFS transporter